MEEKLRISDNLENICKHNNVALEGDLVCKCGNHYFKIYHSGKQTKGIFAPYLIKNNGQIVIEAKCTCCEHSIIIFDNSIDGVKRLKAEETTKKQFHVFNDAYAYKIHLMYNYLENNFNTNLFDDCFIEISNGKFKRSRRLFEGV